MNKQRLLKLAEYLENEVPKKKFNLKAWMADSDYFQRSIDQSFISKTRDIEKFPSAFEETDKIDGTSICTPVECQTVGCALGWGTMIPSFRKAGLVLIANEERIANCDKVINLADIALVKDGEIVARHFEAAAIFFKIPEVIAEWLFDPYAYPASQRKSPKAVSKRIRKLLDGKVIVKKNAWGDPTVQSSSRYL